MVDDKNPDQLQGRSAETAKHASGGLSERNDIRNDSLSPALPKCEPLLE